jgi:hypothetical protein
MSRYAKRYAGYWFSCFPDILSESPPLWRVAEKATTLTDYQKHKEK